ncbi:MAG: tetratricopeptide repeat-containing protein, partial [Xanthobacteraceae bacterium]
DWNVVLDFVHNLPNKFRDEPQIQENRAFAAAQTGDDVPAIAELETLIDLMGPTPERLGLLGGRYKRLAKVKTTSREEQRQALDKAIAYYEQGMELDLNAYYCSSNLPRLYRKRAEALDEERAQIVLRQVISACERAIKLNIADDWVRPTLLGAAFDLGTPDKAEELAKAVIAEGPPKWKVDTVVGDLEESVRHVCDAATRTRLAAVMERIKAS